MSPVIGAQTKKLLAAKIQAHRRELFEWHLAHAKVAPPPFYCSVDLRDAGYKIVPVDSNLFPAGFNNICPDDQRTSPAVVRAQINASSERLNRPMPKKILILPESHTTNTYYIENLYYLSHMISEAGFEVRIGWWGERSDDGLSPATGTEPVHLLSATQKQLTAYPIEIKSGQLTAGDFVPELVIVNNDFSGGYPKALDQVGQAIMPSHALGWHTRKKSEHFVHYNRLAAEFAMIIDIDPWMIQIETARVDHVNFNEDLGIDAVAAQVKRILSVTEAQYAAHEVTRKPFVFIKNNAGTYGIGIMVVHSVDEVLAMNRRTKNKMSVGKNKSAIDSLVIQEGVPTATLVDRLSAEPVIYLVGCELIGGFLRSNTEKGDEENLNSQGMVFRKLCMSDLKNPMKDDEESSTGPDEREPVLELVYGSIARISALATGYEMKGIQNGS